MADLDFLALPTTGTIYRVADLERERNDSAKAGPDSEEHSVPELHNVN